MSARKKAVSIALGAAVGAALFAVAFRGVSVSRLWAIASRADPAWIAVLLAIPVVDLLIRAYRWRILLAPLAPASLGTVYAFEAVGMALNNLVFLRLGEVARGILLARELGIHALSVFATILIERLCDLGALLVLYVVGATMVPGVMDPRIRTSAAAGAAGIAAALALMTVAGERVLSSPAGSWIAKFPVLDRLVRDLIAGTQSLRSPGAAAAVAASSISLWMLDASLFLAAARALRLDPMLSFSKALLALSSAAAGSALPAVPGAFGNFEAAVKLTLMKFGYSGDVALTFAATAHLAGYLVMTAIGLVCLFRLGHSLSSLTRLLEREKK